ncbi:3-deoxy-7-phosphoheptulonate synthase [Nocardia takedensis]
MSEDLDTRPVTARQQPVWEDERAVALARRELAQRAPLVDGEAVARLRRALVAVAAGEALVVQAGDCAEDPAERTAADIARKVGLLDALGGELALRTGRPVLRVGRIAGQYAKPRGRTHETVAGVEIPSYRGHLVNGPEPLAQARRPDPRRLLDCYEAAREVMGHLGWRGLGRYSWDGARIWTSHEALLLDYEIPQVRATASGALLGSTHWPWIGERTRDPDGAHVRLLAEVRNPVACKIGPDIDVEELIALCERLDPAREPGRLTLIVRMGAAKLAQRLPRLVRAVRARQHPVIWMCDPMHANTVILADGAKTRYLDAMVREVTRFRSVLLKAGAVAGGLHLETTPDDVGECLSDPSRTTVGKYTSLCDPRLAPPQARAVVAAWHC